MKQKDQLPQGLRFSVFRRDNFTCRYCGRSSPAVVLHCDHKHPRSKGGEDVIDNLVTACSDCNYGKRAQVVENVPEGLSVGGSLVGFFGYTLEQGKQPITPEHQFQVVRQVEDGYMVQLFDWLMGDNSHLQFYPVSVLLDSERVRLYATKRDWVFFGRQMMERDWNDIDRENNVVM